MFKNNLYILLCFTVFILASQRLKADDQLQQVSLTGFAGTKTLASTLKLTQVTQQLAAYIQPHQPDNLILTSDTMPPVTQRLRQQQINTIAQTRLDFNWQARHFIIRDLPEWLLPQAIDFIME